MTRVHIFLLLLTSVFVHIAGAASRPYISSVSTYYPGPTVSVNISTIDQPPSLQLVPCTASCFYGLMLYYGGVPAKPDAPKSVHTLFGLHNGKFITWDGPMTWAEAHQKFIQKFGMNTAISWQWNWRPKNWDVCMGVLSGAVNAVRPGAPLTLDGASCTPIPPSPSPSCTLTGSLTIDHGLLAPNSTNNNFASTDTTLQCDGSASLRVMMLPDRIDLGGGVVSTLSVNGVASGGVVTSNGGARVISFESRLSSTGALSGVHSGSGIIILAVE